MDPFASNIDALIHSNEPVLATAFSEDDGYLLSYAKPIYDSSGNYVASACVDFSMDKLHDQNIRFVMVLGAILFVAGLAILVLTMSVLKKTITNPLLKISKAVSNFNFNTEEDRQTNYEAIKSLNLNSNNEIGLLYHALLSSEKDNLYYMSNYKKAEDEIHNKDVQITALGTLALRDSLTNVGNKAAFTASVSEIHDSDKYGILLMDANNLKMINDNYGHEAGDTYIKGCSTVLCDVFGHSPVFRIGGDEFAVILKGRDYQNKDALFKELNERFDQIWADRENDPPNRYSCAAGMADSTECSSVRDTIKTADEAMYENKKRFKEKYGSYR